MSLLIDSASFPVSLGEFQKRYGSSHGSLALMEAARWPDGFACHKCSGTRHSKSTGRAGRQLYLCQTCYHRTSLTAGSLLGRTKVAPSIWCSAIFLYATDYEELGATGLCKQLAIGGNHTGIEVLRKIRSAISLDLKRPLNGPVDSSWITIPFLSPSKQDGQQLAIFAQAESSPVDSSKTSSLSKNGEVRISIRSATSTSEAPVYSPYLAAVFDRVQSALGARHQGGDNLEELREALEAQAFSFSSQHCPAVQFDRLLRALLRLAP